MMWPDVPFRPADLLSSPLPLATGRLLSGAPAVASANSSGFQQAPVLSAPLGRAADAAPRDDGLRPRSRARAGLMEISGQPLILVSEGVPGSAFPETPTASDVSTAVPRAPVSRAAIRFASAVAPSLVVALPAAARELPAAARELPLSDDGPSYEPPKLCYPGLCYQAILAYAQPATPAPAPRPANLLKLPAGSPAGQPQAEAPATPAAELPGHPEPVPRRGAGAASGASEAARRRSADRPDRADEARRLRADTRGWAEQGLPPRRPRRRHRLPRLRRRCSGRSPRRARRVREEGPVAMRGASRAQVRASRAQAGAKPPRGRRDRRAALRPQAEKRAGTRCRPVARDAAQAPRDAAAPARACPGAPLTAVHRRKNPARAPLPAVQARAAAAKGGGGKGGKRGRQGGRQGRRAARRRAARRAAREVVAAKEGAVKGAGKGGGGA